MGKIFKDYREESRSTWGMYLEQGEKINRDQMRTGAILRIADSLEKMEQPFKKLLDDVEFYRNSSRALQKRNDTLRKQVAAYQGIINRMKKQRS